jgi:hypothetical protein
MGRAPIQRSYSGDRSEAFWARIKAIKPYAKWQAAYTLGVALQNLEGEILRQIESLEGKPK